MDQVLQWIGGVGYLLNKIFFVISERAESKGKQSSAINWLIAAWIMYLAGLIPWVILFAQWNNWIAASVELGGAPAMVLGLSIAIRSGKIAETPAWLELLAKAGIVCGVSASLHHFGGLVTINQWLEAGLAVGFLVGTYQRAKKQLSGYWWLILMHLSCGCLMWIQDFPWLLLHQVLSLGFVVDALRVARQRIRFETHPSNR